MILRGQHAACLIVAITKIQVPTRTSNPLTLSRHVQIIARGDIFQDDEVDPDLLGSGSQTQPELHDYLVIHYDCHFSNKEGSTHDESKEFIEEQFNKKDLDESSGFVRLMEENKRLIKLGNGDVTQGLELAARFLSLGQCAIVKCHAKYAHPLGRKNDCNEKGSCDLPCNKNVIYRVYLQSIKPSKEDQSYSFRFKLAKQLKAAGNDYYKFEWTNNEDGGIGKIKSIKAYNEASRELASLLKDIKDDTDSGTEQCNLEEAKRIGSEALSLLVDCYNNIAAVQLRAKDYVKVKEAAAEAIKLDPNNIKALCRAAKASMCTGAFEECQMALDAANEIDGSSKDVQKLKSEFEHRLKLYQKREKDMYAKMLGGKGREKEKKIQMDNNDVTNRQDSSDSATSNTAPADTQENETLCREKKSNARGIFERYWSWHGFAALAVVVLAVSKCCFACVSSSDTGDHRIEF